MLIRTRPGWELPESTVTPEKFYVNRRQLLAAAGFLGAQGLAADTAKRNPEFADSSKVTPEFAATGYNNFYELHPTDKERPKDMGGKFVTEPWSFEVSGLVNKPKKYDLDDIRKRMPMEERIYRFRCVETWAMVVPWTGFPISQLIKEVEPLPKAKYLRFVTANRPDQFPGMKMAPFYPWPYHEGLRMDEAMNPLAMFVTGLYGKPLPKQNGAPIRVVTPWKYGYKSIKSIVKIEFTEKEPPTLWNKVHPSEYGFYSNVEPAKPHPRWSQANERLIPTGERQKTLQYNGYEKYVAGMYNGKEF